MSEVWIRQKLTAEFLSDAHLGSGMGSGGIDALVSRDRNNLPVIWSSHLEGVLRDAARRLLNNEEAGKFFGHAGGEQQKAVFTSLYTKDNPESHIWRSAASIAFDNRASKDESLRVIEYVPKGTTFVGEVELLKNQLNILKRLVMEVDSLGSGRSTGAGRVRLSLSDGINLPSKDVGGSTNRLKLLFKNRDPICITATTTPDNLIPSLAFIPGRTLLGAIAAWLIAEGDRETATLITSGKVSVSDALPLPSIPENLDVEILPAPLSLQSEKPEGATGDLPWWAQQQIITKRLDIWAIKRPEENLKRPEDDLFVYRENVDLDWIAFRPARRVRLRNGRSNPKQADTLLFSIEQIVEETCFLAELQGSPDDLKKLTEKIKPVLEGQRWLRMGRGGAPIEVAKFAWFDDVPVTQIEDKALLILTSDLLLRDEYLRWRIALDKTAFRELLGDEVHFNNSIQDSMMIRGFNGTSRLWRMPAAAVRRGSVFEVSGIGVAKLAERTAKNNWLGERTNEGFGRFRIDASLPGAKKVKELNDIPEEAIDTDVPEEVIAVKTKEWFKEHKSLTKFDRDRKPSLSQWLDFITELKTDPNVISRLEPTTINNKNWEYKDAKAILKKLQELEPNQRAIYAQFFVRWLRSEMRKETKRGR